MKVRRVVFAIDSSRSSLQAVTAVAELAAALHAEVSGVFVEDVNLLRWASLPFASEVESHTAIVRQRGRVEVERQLRSRAAHAEQMVTQVATRLQVPTSFRILRGDVATELLTGLSGDDLLIVGKGRRSIERQSDLGATVRTVVSQVRGRVLMLGQRPQVVGRVVVVYRDSPAGRIAFGTAIELVSGRLQDLTVLAPAGSARVRDDLAADLLRRGFPLLTNVTVRTIASLHPARMLAALQPAADNVLVFPADGRTLSDRDIEEVVRRYAGHVLIVRVEEPNS